MSALIEPISNETPSGSDLKYDDLYVAIETEIDKLNMLSGYNEINWRFISDNGQSLLREKTKDLKLLVWWALARYKLDAFDALLDAFETINHFLNHYGETLFPLSPRAKLGALVWFENQINSVVLESATSLIPDPLNGAFLVQFKEYRDHAQRVSGTNDTFFREIIDKLEMIQKAFVPAPQIPTPAPTALASIGDEELTCDADALRMLNQLKKNGEKLSQFWRSHHPHDLRSLKMMRLMSWLDIDETPPSQGGKTLLNGPSAQRLEEIDALIAQNNIPHAIELLETTLLRAPFWFAGQRMVVELLEGEGKQKEALWVKHSVIAMLKSFEGMSDAVFKDGTSFVPSEMKSWIQSDEYPERTETRVDTYELVKEECYGLIKRNETKGAMEKIQHHCIGATSKEEEFKWRLLQCNLALEASKAPMALAILNDLETMIEQCKLDIWRPDLSSRVYQMILTSFTRAQIEKDQYERCYQRLCQIDPAAAIAIKTH